MLWSGTAGSAVDLNHFLASGFIGSFAQAIDTQGNIVGWAFDASEIIHAILWKPVPDPSTWKGPGGGSFNLPSSWTNNSVPNGVNATANFSGNITAPSTVTLDDSVTLGTLIFNSSQSYTLAGASNLILQTSSGNASINVLAGSHEISVPVVVNSDTVISGAGTLDLSGGIIGPHTLTILGDLTTPSINVDILNVGPTGAAVIPEPSTLVLLFMGAIGLLGYLRRWRVTVATLAPLLLFFINSPATANTTYNFVSYPDDQNHMNLSGFILTDGATGYLGLENFLGGKVTISSADGVPIVTSTFGYSGPGIYATPTALTIPFSDSFDCGIGSGTFEIDWSNNSSWSNYSGRYLIPTYQLLWETSNPQMDGTNPWVIAQVPTWKGPGGGSFNLPSSWTNNSVPNGVNATANFSGNITAPSTVTLDDSVTLGTLIFNSSQSYTLAGASNLILQVSSGTASIDMQNGSQKMSVPVIINSDTVITGAGTLDLSGGISGAHTLTVLNDLNAASIQVGILNIGTTGAMAVPEPSTFVLLGVGVISLLAYAWRRRRV